MRWWLLLTAVEWAFRVTRNELETRTIWHQREELVLAHILVCFLSCLLWNTLSQWARRAGRGDVPRPRIGKFAKIESGNAVLPAQMADGGQFLALFTGGS